MSSRILPFYLKQNRVEMAQESEPIPQGRQCPITWAHIQPPGQGEPKSLDVLTCNTENVTIIAIPYSLSRFKL
jgi:hypothetical protein